MREELRAPFGKVLKGEEFIQECRGSKRPLICVGDFCCLELIGKGIVPDILVFDFKIKRSEITREMKERLASHAKGAFVVLSMAGTISGQLEEAVKRVLESGKGAVIVVGEEDLASLLVMAYAKEGTLAYGQPDQGAVVVPLGGKEITEKAKGLLGRMERQPLA